MTERSTIRSCRVQISTALSKHLLLPFKRCWDVIVDHPIAQLLADIGPEDYRALRAQFGHSLLILVGC